MINCIFLFDILYWLLRIRRSDQNWWYAETWQNGWVITIQTSHILIEWFFENIDRELILNNLPFRRKWVFDVKFTTQNKFRKKILWNKSNTIQKSELLKPFFFFIMQKVSLAISQFTYFWILLATYNYLFTILYYLKFDVLRTIQRVVWLVM